MNFYRFNLLLEADNDASQAQKFFDLINKAIGDWEKETISNLMNHVKNAPKRGILSRLGGTVQNLIYGRNNTDNPNYHRNQFGDALGMEESAGPQANHIEAIFRETEQIVERAFLENAPQEENAPNLKLFSIIKGAANSLREKVRQILLPGSSPSNVKQSGPVQGSVSAEVSEGDKQQSYLKRLTYGAPIETLEGSHKESSRLYADELAKHPDQNEIESVKKKLMSSLNAKIGIVEKNGVLIKTPEGNKTIKVNEINPKRWEDIKTKTLGHETWALWDIGKQMYMSKNPSKSGEGYKVGDPLKDENIQNDIVNRMIGWAVTGGSGKDMKGNKLSSKDLIVVGQKAIEGEPLFE